MVCSPEGAIIMPAWGHHSKFTGQKMFTLADGSFLLVSPKRGNTSLSVGLQLHCSNFHNSI